MSVENDHFVVALSFSLSFALPQYERLFLDLIQNFRFFAQIACGVVQPLIETEKERESERTTTIFPRVAMSLRRCTVVVYISMFFFF